MLQITIPLSREGWDEVNEEFVEAKTYELRLEHSLVSLSKWEEKWCKPFLSNTELTDEETFDYIKCMTVTKNVPDEVYDRMTESNINDILNYIKAPMTATTFAKEEPKNKINGEIITAEIVYYWMISLQIPFECRKWHLNKLITLIRVCSKKNEPPRKMTNAERAALNAARKKKHKTKG